VTAVVIVSIVSAVLSIMPHQSWWGRTPAGFEAGEYSALMYVILGVSAFISLQNDKQLRWFLLTLALTGSLSALIGTFQYFGWSFLDISSTHNTRITGTNGNPIFFAAMLLMLVPITLLTLLNEYSRANKTDKNYWLFFLGLASISFGIAFISTVSRGAWISAFVSGIVAAILLLALTNSRSVKVPLTVAIVCLLVGGVLARTWDPDPFVVESTGQEHDNAFQAVGRTNTIDLRMRYWSLATEAALERNEIPHTNDLPQAIRWFVGYGPDMFRYAGTYLSDHTTFTRRLTAAHNDPINRLFEQGLLGFLAWMAMWAAMVVSVLKLIKSSRGNAPDIKTWLTIALAAAFTGRFVEQLFGSPTSGGTLIFWLLVGLLGSITISRVKYQSIESLASHAPRVPRIATQIFVVIAIIGSLVIMWDKGASYLIANQLTSFQYREDELTYDDAVSRLKQAASLAPDHQRYWGDLANLEQGRATNSPSETTRNAAWRAAYDYDLRAYEANPMEVIGIYRLAYSAWEAGNNGHPELRLEAVQLYERLTEIVPSDTLAKERLETLRNALENSGN